MGGMGTTPPASSHGLGSHLNQPTAAHNSHSPKAASHNSNSSPSATGAKGMSRLGGSKGGGSSPDSSQQILAQQQQAQAKQQGTTEQQGANNKAYTSGVNGPVLPRIRTTPECDQNGVAVLPASPQGQVWATPSPLADPLQLPQDQWPPLGSDSPSSYAHQHTHGYHTPTQHNQQGQQHFQHQHYKQNQQLLPAFDAVHGGYGSNNQQVSCRRVFAEALLSWQASMSA